MATYRITKGLDLPITGQPEQQIDGSPEIARVALLGDDYHGLKARLAVQEGDQVARGQLLFEDRRNPGVRHTAPGAGKIVAINRGDRRVLLSIVVYLTEAEQEGEADRVEHAEFDAFTRADGDRSADEVRALLVESGLWTAFRTRPFSKIPPVDSTPEAVFVTAIDTSPLAPSPEVVIGERRADFERGLRLVARLAPTTHLCVARGSSLGDTVDAPIQRAAFEGPHPAGNAGVHIHRIHPVARGHVVWTVGYQDVIAIGRLFEDGRYPADRIIAVAGPPVARPRLVRARVGASIDDLMAGEETSGEVRHISGSVLAGKKAMGPVFGFLGRYDRQVSVLYEARERELLGWAGSGARRFSIMPVFLSRLFGPTRFDMTTSTHGSHRVIMPIGVYEQVLPMDIMATYLLRSLSVGDLEQAEKLGALELDEEDIALCTFVCPGKNDYGPILRRALDRLEKEG